MSATTFTNVPHWMLGPEGWTMPVCEIDLRPGGAWHFVWRMADGNEMEMRGTYREIVAPARLVSTEAAAYDLLDKHLAAMGGWGVESMKEGTRR
jgi:uncharacterized protein YndB with AHSA1/START domain